MLDAKLRAEIDQSFEMMVEMLPPLWRGLFEGCKAKGFTDDQAMELVKIYILSQGSNKIDSG